MILWFVLWNESLFGFILNIFGELLLFSEGGSCFYFNGIFVIIVFLVNVFVGNYIII